LPQGAPTFRSDVLTVTVDVAVLDNHGKSDSEDSAGEVPHSRGQHAAEGERDFQ